MLAPLEIVFQEQSYSCFHSGRSLAWDHFRGDIDDRCGIIADFCGVIANPQNSEKFSITSAELSTIGGRAVADMAMPIIARLTKHRKTLLNIVKHHETLVKRCDIL